MFLQRHDVFGSVFGSVVFGSVFLEIRTAGPDRAPYTADDLVAPLGAVAAPKKAFIQLPRSQGKKKAAKRPPFQEALFTTVCPPNGQGCGLRSLTLS